ncbi:SgcJ/EcaC family oxidoreductase [Nocardia rhizosphaerihabitans]|nr:SgcJ/EcaC family oxidoreductase [Nocardia rhizosphaerihabitans]
MTTITAPHETVPAQGRPMTADADAAAVRQLLATQSAAWAAGDGTAFAATFTEDADFVSVIGEFIQGRAELATVMQEGFDGFMHGTRLSDPERTTVRFPAADLAVLVTYGVSVLRPDTTVPPTRTAQIRTAVRTGGRWLFTSFQNTRIVPQ